MVAPDDDGGHEPDRDRDDYAKVPTDRRRIVWYWRVRLGAATGPVVWFLMQDAPPLFVFALGLGTGIGVMSLASALARAELRLREMRRARR